MAGSSSACGPTIPAMARGEREILEHAVHTIAEQAAKADDLVDEAIGVGHGRSDPLVTHAKMLRLELVKVKADLERSLRTSYSTARSAAWKCTACADSASPLGIGRTESRRRTASPAFRPGRVAAGVRCASAASPAEPEPASQGPPQRRLPA